jgi:uncharacterized membrane protein YgcG
MSSQSSERFRVGLPLLAVWIGFLLVLGAVSVTMASTNRNAAPLLAQVNPSPESFEIASFSFSPTQTAAGNEIQGMVSLSGGTTPFYLWFNDTAPGCGPSSNPVSLSGPSMQFNCTPSGPGGYSFHLDALDSASPPDKASQTAPLTVTNNNGNGNGGSSGNSGSNGGNGSSGGGNNGGFQIPSTLITMLMLFGIVFLASIVALAAGMIAVAVLVSRRLRQLTETMAKVNTQSSAAKPPK